MKFIYRNGLLENFKEDFESLLGTDKDIAIYFFEETTINFIDTAQEFKDILIN